MHSCEYLLIDRCRAAADAGATAWSTAMFYGNPGHHTANIELIRRFFDKVSCRTIIETFAEIHPVPRIRRQDCARRQGRNRRVLQLPKGVSLTRHSSMCGMVHR